MTGAVIALLGIGLMLSSAKPSKVARQLERSLERQLPGAQDVKVRIAGKSGPRTLAGKFDRVEIEITGLDLDDAQLQNLLSAYLSRPHPMKMELNEETKLSPSDRMERERTGRGTIGKELGSIKLLILRLRETRWQKLRVCSVELTVPGVRYDLSEALKNSRLKLESAGVGELTLTIEEGDLTNYVTDILSERQIEQTELLLSDAGIELKARQRIWLIGIPFFIQGTLHPEGDAEIHLEPERMVVAGFLPIPQPATHWLLRSVNPLVSLRSLPLPISVKLKRVETSVGQLKVYAEVEFPSLVSKPSQIETPRGGGKQN